MTNPTESRKPLRSPPMGEYDVTGMAMLPEPPAVDRRGSAVAPSPVDPAAGRDLHDH